MKMYENTFNEIINAFITKSIIAGKKSGIL
jgi:hypothetical protein